EPGADRESEIFRTADLAAAASLAVAHVPMDEARHAKPRAAAGFEADLRAEGLQTRPWPVHRKAGRIVGAQDPAAAECESQAEESRSAAGEGRGNVGHEHRLRAGAQVKTYGVRGVPAGVARLEQHARHDRVARLHVLRRVADVDVADRR